MLKFKKNVLVIAIMGKDKYEAGYGKPPKDNQFKKGTSGNPKGRPKKAAEKPFLMILNEEMNEIVPITNKNGEMVEYSKKELIVKRFVHRLMNGDATALKALLFIAENGHKMGGF